MKKFPKTYIGDGAFIKCDEVHVILTTSNGYEDTNTVYLDDIVLSQFLLVLQQNKFI